MGLNTLLVPEYLKKEFRKVYGKIFYSTSEVKIPESTKLITVGDISSYNAIKENFKPDVIVYDGRELKKPVNRKITNVLEGYEAKKFVVKNPAGFITEELWKVVKESLKIKSRVKIFVEGEEDLTVFPFVLEAPEKTFIIYGFVNKGILLKVDKRIKDKCKELLKQMKGS